MTTLEDAIITVMARAWGQGDPEEMERMLLTLGVDPDEMRLLARQEAVVALTHGAEEGTDPATLLTAHGVNMFLAGAEHQKRRSGEQEGA